MTTVRTPETVTVQSSQSKPYRRRYWRKRSTIPRIFKLPTPIVPSDAVRISFALIELARLPGCWLIVEEAGDEERDDDVSDDANPPFECIHAASTPNFSATSTMASMARSRCSRVCAALIWQRSRACPCGTTGKPNPET